ncbi:MAG TPA: sigma 54-interacting transcriptional regulator [Desulfomonilaceae bacterium]|nr:sigma 54-interacting transcriptional regulator [Desulfomonilaceae bacterium]
MASEAVNILLVEDEEAHAEAVKRAFQPLGSAVCLSCASNIREALEHLDESVPHLVIADWLLPDGKGTDILSGDKERDLFPVILMTSHGNEKVAVDALKAGVVDYVVKSPAAFAALPRTAERVLREWELLAENKRAHEALRVSEERFRAIFESAGDLILIKDLSLRYTHVNPACERTFGLLASEIIGRTAKDIYDGDAASYSTDVDERVLQGEVVEGEYVRRIRAVPMAFHEIKVPLRNGSGNIIGICGVSRDITDRRVRELTPHFTGDAYPSEAMQEALKQARSAATRDSVILLLGESGSGKDYLARYIHDHSKRANGPFFSVNCAAVPPELAESELFGHERGAFTGALGRKRGLLELAEGGTLLLNEIGELSLPLQAKLLTFLDTMAFTRVGGERNVSINARILTATNRELEKEVEAGRFRQDLYYRINVMAIIVPPLRERSEDIPILAEEIFSALMAELQLNRIPLLDSSTINALTQYHWPGNVRELRNVLERALLLWDGEHLDLDLPELNATQRERYYKIDLESDRSLRDVTDEITKTMCTAALQRCGGNKREAARLLGIARDSLYRYMKEFGIESKDRT